MSVSGRHFRLMAVAWPPDEALLSLMTIKQEVSLVSIVRPAQGTAIQTERISFLALLCLSDSLGTPPPLH